MPSNWTITSKPLRAAIYARVPKKARSTCPHCHKIVRVVDRCLVRHRDRQGGACRGTDERIADTADPGQDTENQLIQLREYCKRKGWAVVTEYVDRETGKHAERDAFRELFAGASRREFDVVLVWALDGFTRGGVYDTFDHVRKLNGYGVQFESHSEPHLRTTGPLGELMLAIAAWLAKQERQRIAERTKAGLARARTQGKHCGRPVRAFRRDKAIELRKQGLSWRAIAEKLDVPFATVRRSVCQKSPKNPRNCAFYG